MQVYKGLEITTNKTSLHELQNTAHHFLAEFERYFREYPSEKVESLKGKGGWDQMRRGVYEEAVREIKENTRQLAKGQIGKIKKLRDGGWELQLLDATAAVGKAGFSGAGGAHDDDDHVFFTVVTVGLESGRSTGRGSHES